MRWPARTIWDTRIQSVCGVLSANGEDGVELYLSANFGQVSLSPPRVAVNPNRLYPIERDIRMTGRFAINVMPPEAREQVIRLMKLRRREPRKSVITGMAIREDAHAIPFLDGALRTVFCEVETVHDTGDHTLIIARVLESRIQAVPSRRRPLLYGEVADPLPRWPVSSQTLRTVLLKTGALDLVKRLYFGLRPPPTANLPETTFQMGGHTDSEITAILQYGLLDKSRRLTPPAAPAIVKRKIAICVLGVGSWGSYHCQLIRKVSPSARLFVCGRSAERTARLARAMGAEDFVVGLEKAVADPRLQAYVVALPHDLHRSAVEMIAGAGRHAMVEKPIATTLRDADAMIDAAKQANTILMVAEDMHFRPAIREAARRIQQGDLGEPLYFLAHAGGVFRPQGWKAAKDRSGGGVLMDIGVHYVRGLRLLMGEPSTVFASRAMQINTKMSGEDSLQLLLSSRPGWEAHMLLSWASQRGHLPDIVVTGEKGTLHLWPGAPYVDYYPVAARPVTTLISYLRPYWLQAKLRCPEHQRVRLAVPEGEGTGYLAELREFLSAIAEGRSPTTPAGDGRRDLEIVLCAYDSLERGARVDIAPL